MPPKSPEEIDALIAALLSGHGDGQKVGVHVTGVLAKYDGEGTEGKEPVEVLRFVDGKLVEHLVQGQPQPLPAQED